MGIELRDSKDVSLKETRAGTIVSIVISLIAMGVLSVCLSRRVQNVRDWARLPLVCWLGLLVYIDSIAFVASSAILENAFGIDSSRSMCSNAIVLCLCCYMTTKLLYYFLVERAYIIRRSTKPRLKDKLYLFNSFGMLIPYCVVIALNFYFRFAIYEGGVCRIGMKRVAMIPLIGFDILVNVYLTSLFLIPLRSLYSYKNNRNSQTRSVALRTFIGSLGTLTSTVVNLTVTMALNGEPGWICLMCCNIDILFSVLVLHWITSKDNASTIGSSQNGDFPNRPGHNSSPPGQPGKTGHRSLTSDIAGLELEPREFSKAPGVTTVVSVDGDMSGDSRLGHISLPPNVVTVETVTTLESGLKRESGSCEWPTGRTDSTDDLCKKV